MKINIAKHCGFCYGVKRAVELAYSSAKKYNKISTLGPLIHNPQVVEELKEIGVDCKESIDSFIKGEAIIFRSHGVGPNIYKQAEDNDLIVIDATCPNVKIAQKKGYEFDQLGLIPIIIGEKKHPEVKSIVQWSGNRAIVIEESSDIKNVPKNSKYGVLIQTTFEYEKFEKLLAQLQNDCPGEYEIAKTICLATSNRQDSALKLAKESDAVIVIGGKNSANTRHLYEIVKEQCVNSFHIETVAELDITAFKFYKNIGITAGASTPERIIKEALQVMENMESFKSLLDSEEVVEVFPGKTIKGEVIKIDKDGVYVSFGYMKEGFIAYAQWSTEDPETIMETVKEGDVVEAKVVPSASSDDFIRLSKIKAEQDAAWKSVAPLAEGEKRVANVKVLRLIKNKTKNIVGLSVLVEGVEGFMPASLIELRRIEDFSKYLGMEFNAEIIEVDLEKKRLIVSRKELLKEEREAKSKAWKEEKEARTQAMKAEKEEKEEKAYASVTEGEVLKGKVIKVMEFGLLVEVGEGLVGLVHNTELSWNRKQKAADVASEGDEVTVLVMKIDKENKRVGLSIKATQENPWIVAAKELQEGAIYEGTVERFLTFGAIVRLNSELEGLVHVSEIADTRIAKAEDVLSIGDVVKVKVLKIDIDKKKISLSINKAQQEADRAEYAAYMKE